MASDRAQAAGRGLRCAGNGGTAEDVVTRCEAERRDEEGDQDDDEEDDQEKGDEDGEDADRDEEVGGREDRRANDADDEGREAPQLMRALLPVVYTLLVLAVGGALSVQTQVNARLGQQLGHPIVAAAASFIIGLVLLLVIAFLVRAPMPTGEALAATPLRWWIGGALGALFIAISIVIAPRIGLGYFATLVIAGQLIAALWLEHSGWLETQQHPVTLVRVLGAVLVLLGAMLVRR